MISNQNDIVLSHIKCELYGDEFYSALADYTTTIRSKTWHYWVKDRLNVGGSYFLAFNR
jgi:hypothetical protein